MNRAIINGFIKGAILTLSILSMACPGDIGRRSVTNKEKTDQSSDGGPSADDDNNDNTGSNQNPFQFTDSGNTTGPKSPQDAGVKPAVDQGTQIKQDLTKTDPQPQADGCYLLNPVCKDHPEYGRPEKFLDVACKGNDQDCCLDRAARVAYWCGNDSLVAPFPMTTATYEVNGQVVAKKVYQTGDACLVCFNDCPNDKVFEAMLPTEGHWKGCTHDYLGYTNGGEADKNQNYCVQRIKDYFEYCKKGSTKFWTWGAFYKGWIQGQEAYYEVK